MMRKSSVIETLTIMGISKLPILKITQILLFTNLPSNSQTYSVWCEGVRLFSVFLHVCSIDKSNF